MKKMVLILLLVIVYASFFVLIYSMNSTEQFKGSAKGRERMKKYNVIFAGTIRNVEKYIEKGISDIDLCGKKFNDYAVILYENDSDDKTRSILENHKKDNYYYIFEDNITEPLRTKRLENGRNKILDKMREINKDQYYDYLIVLDMDDINQSGSFVDSIETNFDHKNWDVLTGNQTRYYDIWAYYDLWAIRKKNEIDYDYLQKIREERLGRIYGWFKHVILKAKRKYNRNQGLIEVDSAFGGAAIYKIKSIPSYCRYVGTHPDGDQKCEHVEFNECIKNNGGSIYINTAFLTN